MNNLSEILASASFTTVGASGTKYLVLTVRVDLHAGDTRGSQAVIISLDRDGQSRFLPYTLSLGTRLFYGIGVVWPPEVPTALRWNGAVELDFREYAASQDGTYFREFLWRGRFDSRRTKWSLKRLQPLKPIAADWRLPAEVKLLKWSEYQKVITFLDPDGETPFVHRTSVPSTASTRGSGKNRPEMDAD